jgi:hypothetical protein
MTVAPGLGPWVLQPSAGRAKLLRSCASRESAARRSFESLPASRSNGSALEAARRPECPVLTPSPAPLERRAVSWQERRGTLPVSLTGRPTSKSGFAAGSKSRMGAQPLPRQYWGGSRWRLRTRRASRNAPPAKGAQLELLHRPAWELEHERRERTRDRTKMTALEDPTLLRVSMSRREPRMVVSGRADACQRAYRYAVGNGRRRPKGSPKVKNQCRAPKDVFSGQSQNRGCTLTLYREVPRSPGRTALLGSDSQSDALACSAVGRVSMIAPGAEVAKCLVFRLGGLAQYALDSD